MACCSPFRASSPSLRDINSIFATSSRSGKSIEAAAGEVDSSRRRQERYFILALILLDGHADDSAVPPRVQSRKRARNEVKPLSGLDVGALLAHRGKKAKLTAQNLIPEFRQALDNSESADAIRDIAKQFGDVVEQQIKESFGDIMYPRVIEELSVMREEMDENEEPEAWNSFMKGLKTKLLTESLGGDRREMWTMIRKHKLGLIDRKSSGLSEVNEEEAQKVRLIP